MMYTFSVEKYHMYGSMDRMDNTVILKNWDDVYSFSNLFRDSLVFGWEPSQIESYVYLNLSIELTEMLLYNHGGWRSKTTTAEQAEFLHCRFVNVFGVKYPWFRELEKQEYKLIRYSKDRTKIEWVDEQIAVLIVGAFESMYWMLNHKAKNTFYESDEIVSKQELLDYIKNVYAIP